MVGGLGRNDERSPSSESFRLKPDTSSSDSETEISSPEPTSWSSSRSSARIARVRKRRLTRSSSVTSSSEPSSENPNYVLQRKRAKKSASGKPSVDLSRVQEQNTRQGNGHGSSITSTDEENSATDPDIESDDTSSDSGDDGYADGTRDMIARMRDRWERYVKS